MTSRATRRSPRIQERRLAAIPEDEEQTVQPQQEGDNSREVEPLLILSEDEPTQAAEPSSKLSEPPRVQLDHHKLEYALQDRRKRVDICKFFELATYDIRQQLK